MLKRREQEQAVQMIQKDLSQRVINQSYVDSEDKVKRLRIKKRIEEYHRAMEEEEALERAKTETLLRQKLKEQEDRIAAELERRKNEKIRQEKLVQVGSLLQLSCCCNQLVR